ERTQPLRRDAGEDEGVRPQVEAELLPRLARGRLVTPHDLPRPLDDEAVAVRDGRRPLDVMREAPGHLTDVLGAALGAHERTTHLRADEDGDLDSAAAATRESEVVGEPEQLALGEREV